MHIQAIVRLTQRPQVWTGECWLLRLSCMLLMQPLNDRLAALDPGAKEAKGAYGTHQAGAEALLRKWRKWNILRVITPTIAGCVAMWQLCL